MTWTRSRRSWETLVAKLFISVCSYATSIVPAGQPLQSELVFTIMIIYNYI